MNPGKHLTKAAVTAILAVSLPLLAACGGSGSAASHSASPGPPSPASIAARLGCQVSGPDSDAQDAYDTVAYDLLSAQGNPSSLCSPGSGDAKDVITFASQAKETDWLHQNDLANSGPLANGFVGLIVGNLWIVTSGSGVVGLYDLESRLAPIGGRESNSF
jgi:hypothetical protein